jgi:hypothetical protein
VRQYPGGAFTRNFHRPQGYIKMKTPMQVGAVVRAVSRSCDGTHGVGGRNTHYLCPEYIKMKSPLQVGAVFRTLALSQP